MTLLLAVLVSLLALVANGLRVAKWFRALSAGLAAFLWLTFYVVDCRHSEEWGKKTREEYEAKRQAEFEKDHAEAVAEDEARYQSERDGARLCEANPRTIGEVSKLVGSNPISCEWVGPRFPDAYRVSWSRHTSQVLSWTPRKQDAGVQMCEPAEAIDAAKFCPSHYKRGKGWDAPCGAGGPPNTPCSPVRPPVYNYSEAGPP